LVSSRLIQIDVLETASRLHRDDVLECPSRTHRHILRAQIGITPETRTMTCVHRPFPDENRECDSHTGMTHFPPPGPWSFRQRGPPVSISPTGKTRSIAIRSIAITAWASEGRVKYAARQWASGEPRNIRRVDTATPCRKMCTGEDPACTKVMLRVQETFHTGQVMNMYDGAGSMHSLNGRIGVPWAWAMT